MEAEPVESEPIQLSYGARRKKKLGAGGVPLLFGTILVALGLLATIFCAIFALAMMGPPTPPPDMVFSGQTLIAFLSLPGLASVVVGLTLVYRALNKYEW